MSGIASRVLRFGVFEVDLRTGELRRQGLRLRLPSQSFQVLALLLEHPGNLVSREELRKKLWPADTFVDFDHGVNAAVNRLREALGDSAERPKFIETLPRRGYRFIVPLEGNSVDFDQQTPISSATAASCSEPNSGVGDISEIEPPARAPAPVRRIFRPIIAVRLALAFLATASVAVILMLAFQRGLLHLQPSGTANIPRIQSLAVLPLENLSGDPAQEYFADGMTDALITDLSKIGALRVISRTSAMQYKGVHKTVPEIAKELNVDGVVEGSVMRSGNRVRITAQLIQARTDQHLWAETYERDFSDVLKLQSEVAQAIAQQVRVQLTPQQQARLNSVQVVNPAAYEAYLKGRFYESASFATPQAIRNAQRYYEEAIQKDPGLAVAYVGLAKCYENLGSYRWVPPQDAYRPAKEALNKALRLDETLGEAHTELGWLSWRYDWDWPTAEREFNYALELNPNYPNGHVNLAFYLAWSGRRAEALAQVPKLRELAPGLFRILEPAIYYHLRDYKAIVETSRQLVPLNPGDWLSYYFLAVGYEGSGQRLEAIPEYQKAIELSQGDTDPTAGLAHAYATAGQRANAEKILRELLQRSKTSYISPYMIGTIYAGLGDKNKAFQFLEKAYQERSPDIPYFLKADLRIDNLRSDPRFPDLLRRVGLSQ